MPTIPVMSDIRDLFANISNNIYYLQDVFYLLFGILFASFIAYRIVKYLKGGE